MSIRPPRRTIDARRNPSQDVVAGEHITASVVDLPVMDAAKTGPDQNISSLLREFEGILRDDPSIDPASREHFQKQFEQALDQAAADPVPVGALPDRATWLDAIEMLRQSGAVEEGEVNNLVRQIDQALEPLQRRESQLALEFSRRIREEGQERALAWFREQSARVTEDNGAATLIPGSSSDLSPRIGSDVVNSRSRRLRGPPQRS